MSERALIELLAGRRLAVLTGAGVSTESGIPDYRGPETRRRARNPIRFNAFRGDHEARRRYWARSLVGWPRIREARPNAAHKALAELERAGLTTGLITQNVDRLHLAAGSRAVVELHGALAEVVCLGCRAIVDRESLQRRLLALNPAGPTSAELAPDGDAEVEPAKGFVVPGCERCGGPLKPHVVFFGEGVPRERVAQAYSMVEEAEALLVVGTSLAVFSGFRFVKRAAALGLPIGIVNLGESRGDALAQVRVEGVAGEVLPRVVAALSEHASVRSRDLLASPRHRPGL